MKPELWIFILAYQKGVCVCVNTWYVLYLMSVCAGTLYMYIIYIQLYIYIHICCIYAVSESHCHPKCREQEKSTNNKYVIKQIIQ
jgi:hypothetical protein